MATRRLPHLVAMLLETQRELMRSLAGISPEQGEKRLEPLNSMGWVVAHVAVIRDSWWSRIAQGKEQDPWLAQHGPRRDAVAVSPDFAQAVAALQRVNDSADAFLRSLGENDLRKPVPWPDWFRSGRSNDWLNQCYGDLATRDIAHSWGHIGEISTIRSLIGLDAHSFPGDLAGCRYPTEP